MIESQVWARFSPGSTRRPARYYPCLLVLRPRRQSPSAAASFPSRRSTDGHCWWRLLHLLVSFVAGSSWHSARTGQLHWAQQCHYHFVLRLDCTTDRYQNCAGSCRCRKRRSFGSSCHWPVPRYLFRYLHFESLFLPFWLGDSLTAAFSLGFAGCSFTLYCVALEEP